ncbi:MAG: GumC family protein [Parabacteroides sp.]
MSNTQFVKRPTEEFLTLQEFWVLCRSHLHWFAASLVASLCFAFYYLIKTPNTYVREAAVLVREETMGTKAAQSAGGAEFNNMSLIQQPTKVSNVVRQYISLTLLSDVVRRLDPTIDSSQVISQAKKIQFRLSVSQDGEQSTVINLKFWDYSPRHAEEVLNAVIEVYNERWMNERNQLTHNSAHFIDGRLDVIENELDKVDDSISVFKMHHQITDLDRVSDLYLQQKAESEADLLRLTNQLSMAQYIRNLLQDEKTQHQLLPTNTGLSNSEVESQIISYNSYLLKLKNNLVGTSTQNPLILRQEAELDDIRQNILATLSSLESTLQIQLEAIQLYNEEAKEKVTSSPDQAKRLLAVERDQKVKESLYLYLLQKKEENEISMTYTLEPTQVIDMPHGSMFPVAPKKKSVLMAAALFGLLLPAVLLFIMENLNTTVRKRSEVESRTLLPIVGEIPIYAKPQTRAWRKRLSFKKEEAPPTPLVVQHGRQDMINESFRLLRSNLEFMSDHHGHGNVYIITSMHAGSGKTFISMNLALTLAIKGRRVLLIDGDIRRASTSRTLGNRDLGLTDYLGEKVEDVASLIYPVEDHPTFSVLPVGTTPPNPTELLSGPRLPQLIEELRPHYDFILIDCPMTENLADAFIINRYVDRTLYVIRAGLFQRKLVGELDLYVQQGKFKNLSIILNATTPIITRYGYHYGYHYGYYSNNGSS